MLTVCENGEIERHLFLGGVPPQALVRLGDQLHVRKISEHPPAPGQIIRGQDEDDLVRGKPKARTHTAERNELGQNLLL